MIFYSSRSEKYTADSAQAVLKGIAPDGGLYTPVDFESMRLDVADLLNKSAIEISAAVIGR